MNKEEVFRMARMAGIDSVQQYDSDTSPIVLIERFAALVASAERERIAKKIEQLPFGDTSASFAIYVREDA